MRNWSIITANRSWTFAASTMAGFSRGAAWPTRVAPMAMALAASTPLRMPPLANSVRSGKAARASNKASAVGIPQAPKPKATSRRAASLWR